MGAHAPAGEAVRNLRARPVMTAVLLALATAVTCGVYGAEFAALAGVARYQSRLADGGYTTAIVATEPRAGRATLSVADCRALDALADVTAAAGYRRHGSLRLWSALGPEVPLVAVDGDLGLLVEPGGQRLDGDLVADGSLAGILGRDGPAQAVVVTDAGAQHRSFVTRSLGRLGGSFAGAVIEEEPLDEVDGCLVAVREDGRLRAHTSIEVAFPAVAGYTFTWAMGDTTNVESPRDRFSARWSAHAWLAGGAVVIALHALALRVRRAETALYAFLGMGRSSLGLALWFEHLFVAGVPALVGLGVAALDRAAGRSLDVSAGVTLSVARFAALVALGGAVTCWGASRSTSQQLKDR